MLSMKRARLLAFICVLLNLIFYACSPTREDAARESLSKRGFSESFPEIDTLTLKKTDFHIEFVSNGKLHASRLIPLHFKSSGTIDRLFARNGQKLGKGSVLVGLESSARLSELERAKIDLAISKVELSDKLMRYSQDGQMLDSTSVPKNVLENFELTSGYRKAKLLVSDKLRLLEENQLIAPFTGRVSDVQKSLFTEVNKGDLFCYLIDDSSFKVTFFVMETELQLLKIDQELVVTPYSYDKAYKAVISSINPIVDESGLVRVEAVLLNHDASLLEGLNVKVRTGLVVPDGLVVPKKAVLRRDGRSVVFTYNATNDEVQWNYVELLMENSSSYLLKEHESLKYGMAIAVSGHLNLAHETKVQLKNVKLD